MNERPDATPQDIEAECWHGQSVSEWRRRWDVPHLRVFRRTGSTNDVAKAMADAGADEGTLVLADQQTRGRGRRGRTWTAPAGSGLAMSMVVRPPTPGATRVLTLRLGLAAARAIDRISSLPIAIKWPNDLEAGGRKVAGILCEATVVEDRVVHVIAGLGINLRTPRDGWPADLIDRATSLAEATTRLRREGDSPDPAPRRWQPAHPERSDPELVAGLVREWRAVIGEPADTLSPDEMRQFEARDALRGTRVTVDDRPAGEAAGVTEGGALLVHDGHRVRAITAGTVRAAEPVAGERSTQGDHE